MRNSAIALALLAAFMLAAVPAAFADSSCVAKECHAKLLENKFVHGPVGAYDCTSCHTEIGKHKFKMAAEGSELCYLCHEKKNTMAHVHGPIASGDCIGCHSPHSSPYKFQLAGEGPALCFKCHEDNKTKNKFVHGPVAGGDCVACHDPHQSANEFQLTAPGNDLCYTCHVDKKEEFAAGKHIHPPVADRCTNCHNAHSSANNYMLTKAVPDLCYGCHTKMQEYISKVKFGHKPVTETGSCTNCHAAHVSNAEPLLKTGGSDLCLGCHNKPMGELSNIKNWLDSNPDKHGPVRNGDCTGCHNTHGANFPRILIDYYPQEFYAPYSTDKYALCFDCHNKDIAVDEFTTTLTGFRNGDKNQHFVHVNKNPKGRTCRACHEVHAGKQAKHVREKVPFGKLSYPIKFTKTPNGGGCVVGCHVERFYDRVNPVKNK
ncbi:MAG TPA: cytochrome c3 family protein [Nitrospirota bacterium]|jgi:predicted CXXCH cytochrome family protein